MLAHHRDRRFDKIANDLFDVAADIADLGEFRGFDLEEGRAGKLCQPAGDFGLADTGGADHQDVLRINLILHVLAELFATPAVAQRDGDGALGILLPDDEAVEFGHDFPRGEFGHTVIVSTVRLPFV